VNVFAGQIVGQYYSNSTEKGTRTMKKAIFYHAGCPVCVEAEQQLVTALNPSEYTIEEVNLGNDKDRINQAEASGVKSVPAFVIEGTPFHINFGASINDLK
jgi:glutaredoxin